MLAAVFSQALVFTKDGLAITKSDEGAIEVVIHLGVGKGRSSGTVHSYYARSSRIQDWASCKLLDLE